MTKLLIEIDLSKEDHRVFLRSQLRELLPDKLSYSAPVDHTSDNVFAVASAGQPASAKELFASVVPYAGPAAAPASVPVPQPKPTPDPAPISEPIAAPVANDVADKLRDEVNKAMAQYYMIDTPKARAMMQNFRDRFGIDDKNWAEASLKTAMTEIEAAMRF